MIELQPCPFCGCKPIRGLGKKTGCQMHGEPMQAATICCVSKSCPAKPGVSAGDIYNGGKEKANDEAAVLWNTRANLDYPRLIAMVERYEKALKACCEVLVGGSMSKRSLEQALELAREALAKETP